MVFLHPEYLWGLIGLVIPVIIHLFDFRKNRKVYFSDIRFLKQVKHASKKPLKLKQWLILISRLGTVAFLVLVFAQPIIPTNDNRTLKEGTNLIYLDNSQSMSVGVNANESALNRGRTIGQLVVKQSPKGQDIIVTDNDNLSQFWSSLTATEASNQIASIGLSEKPFSLQSMGVSSDEYEKRGFLINEAFIISDFQKSSIGSLPKLDTSVYYWLLPLPLETTLNCVVDSAYRILSDITLESQTKIEVIIRNTGNEEKRDMPVKVFLGDRQVSSTSVTVPAFQQIKVGFTLGILKNDESGYVQIEDYPVSFDNTFYFALNKQQPLRILDLTGAEPSRYIQEVFGNKKLFTLERSDWRNTGVKDLENADFIVLNQVEEPDARLLEALKSVALKRSNVLVIPPTKPNISVYRNILGSLKLVPGYKQKLQQPAKSNPFFQDVLENAQGALEMPDATPVWSWGMDRSAILSYQDNLPYLSEVSKGIYLLSSPLIDSMSTMQTHALFVPVMYKLAFHKSAPDNQLFARTNQEFVDITIDSIDVKDIVKFKMGDMELIPDKQKSGNKWRFMLPNENLKPGIYQIVVNNSIRGAVAFNSDLKESELQMLDKSQLEEYFKAYKHSIVENSSITQRGIENLDRGNALWKYALAICLLFLLTEALLIRFL
ncbi:MAG: BatA domain-containing protein [Cyclobacteriaceae bacterium]|nr:BatA domain-containing protein [Cyclobacteriaceae bacterium]